MTSKLFGPFVGPSEVQEALSATLELWMPTYVAAFNRDAGARKLTTPVDYRFKPKYRTTGAQRPDTVALVPVVSRTIGRPERHGNGSVRLNFSARVECYCYGTDDWQATMQVAYDFGLLVAIVCNQKHSLGGLAESTTLQGLEYGDEDQQGRRITGIAAVTLSIIVAQSFNAFGGPAEPSIAAPAEPPNAQTVNPTVGQPLPIP